MSEVLKPCIFCKSDKKLRLMAKHYTDESHIWWVECARCGAQGMHSHEYERAIESWNAAWNARAAKPCYATDSTHEHCKYSVNRGWVENVVHGTLTAEQVRKAIMSADRWEKPMGDTGLMNTHLIIRDDGWQAIADELNARADLESEPPYDELLRCLENDWHIHASWDGLRRFWNIELTEEGVRLRDELNARAERTCQFTIKDNMNETEGMGDVWIECSACHCAFDFYADEWLMKMSYCPNCRARIEVGE